MNLTPRYLTVTYYTLFNHPPGDRLKGYILYWHYPYITPGSKTETGKSY